MDLRICMNCGYIWDGNDEWSANTCHICKANERSDNNVKELGKVILALKRSDLLNHGKLKGLSK